MKKIIFKFWMLTAVLAIISGICIITSCNNSNDDPVVSPTDDSSQFVNLTDIVPDAILEIRYYGTYNFVGQRIDGYEEPTALLTKQAATALKAVSDDVMAQGYRLKIYDAYSLGGRPQCNPDEAILLSRPRQERTLRTGIHL